MTQPPLDFDIPRLGECRISSPMTGGRFVADSERILYHSDPGEIGAWYAKGFQPPSLELAGPREKIFFVPKSLACGIVTCGGLCPGLNDVIRAIVQSLHYHYGVQTILGFRYGYEGLSARYGHVPLNLTPDAVSHIHEFGGTILGTSRGPQDPGEMVETLQQRGVGILFAVGGDGTLRGAQAMADEAKRRGLPIAVIGVPKTIDNDISFVQKSFGFETAASEARAVVRSAHSEAIAARNGVGLVKLMGRDSGFVAGYATLADKEVNFCLVPEVPFTLDGFLRALQSRLERKGHAVVVVAEGAGQDLLRSGLERDASGNIKHGDIGVFLRDRIKEYFAGIGMELNLKYIDPSYTIRSVPANAHDSAFCLLLGHNAVHAGMTGRTNMVVGIWKNEFSHVPIALAVSQRKRIDPEGWMWSAALACTGQPRVM